MRTIAEMVDTKKQLVKKSEAILSEIENGGGSMTNEQKRQFDQYTEEIKRINDTIDEEVLSLPVNQPILNKPYNPMACVEEQRIPVARAVSKSFRGMFYGSETTKLSNSGFHSMDEFLKTMHLGRADQRLLNSSMVEGIQEFGGYSVPEEYGAFLMDKSLESEIIRPRATVWGMGSETKKVPAFDGADRTNNLFGGITGEWLEEGASGTLKTAKLRLIQLKAKKLACFSQASNELIADGMSFEEMLAGALIKGLG